MKNYENNQFSLDNKQLIISQLTCPICSGIFRNAIVITKCMHSFCEACLIKFFNSNEGDNKCPICDINVDMNNIEEVKEYHLINKTIEILFPELNEIDNKERSKFYQKYHDYNDCLPDEECYLSNKEKKIFVELAPLPTPMKNDQKLPVISKNNINIPESCRIETIRKYIKEQLGNEDKENFKLRDGEDILIFCNGIQLKNEKKSLKDIKNDFMLKDNTILLFYSK